MTTKEEILETERRERRIEETDPEYRYCACGNELESQEEEFCKECI